MTSQTPAEPIVQPPKRATLWTVIHWVIILNFAFEILYAMYMVFAVLRPEGAGFGPLGTAAKSMPTDQLMVRRMYASEAWIAISGLCVYLAITEIKPRFWGAK